MGFSVEGKTAIVTGAAHGVGSDQAVQGHRQGVRGFAAVPGVGGGAGARGRARALVEDGEVAVELDATGLSRRLSAGAEEVLSPAEAAVLALIQRSGVEKISIALNKIEGKG